MFADLDLDPTLLETLESLGYEKPTPIQRETIPILLDGRDLLGLAATGTGKTAAFALPILQGLDLDADHGEPQALVVVPTRELAMQVGKAIRRYGRDTQATVLSVYGGTPLFHQIRALEKGVDVVVATPGRAVDLLNRGYLRLGSVRFAVLDEADEMLDMGFQEELEALWDKLPDDRQTALFSATFPRRLRQVADTLLTDPVRVEAEEEEREKGEEPRIRQQGYLVRHFHKLAALGRILDMEVPEAALVFCRTRMDVQELAEALLQRGFRAEALHGGRSQSERERVMGLLRSGACNLVVATDVAARGIDIGHLSHVINMDVPEVPEQYVHRIGRTGRAGREGVALTLVDPRDRFRMRDIEQLTGQRILLEPVPTLDEVESRRLEVLTERVRLVSETEELDGLRELVQGMDMDPLDVAAAALEALRRATWEGEDDTQDIPAYAQDQRRPPSPRKERQRRPPPPPEGWAAVFIGMGKRDRLRPGDLFGAILNETTAERGDIGAIEILQAHSVVQIREDKAFDVIGALRATSIRGKKPVIRKDRYAHK